MIGMRRHAALDAFLNLAQDNPRYDNFGYLIALALKEHLTRKKPGFWQS
jgi:hypothetical protein